MQPQLLRWSRIFLVFFSLWGLAEVSSRVGVYVWSGRRYESLTVNVWSPYGLTRNNPRLTSVSYQINKNGFRNLETFEQRKPPRTLRVMVLGGSTMYSGLGGTLMPGATRVDSSSTVAQFLEKKLEADPETKDLEVEVINAAVNFSRIVEVSTSYIAELAYWDADVIIVGGSANNFLYKANAGEVHARKHNIQSVHPWHQEFQRMQSPAPLAAFEKALIALENGSGSAAIARKGATMALDIAFAQSKGLSGRLGLSPPSVLREPATFAEYDLYIQEYLGYAEAMVVVAKRRDQEIAFFWEYLLGHLGGIKPFSEVEEVLYSSNRRASYQTDTLFDERAHDQVKEFCESRSVPFVDPIGPLKTYDGTVFIDYLHYTSEGNEFMAEVMYDQLKPVLHRRAQRLRATLDGSSP